MKNLILIIIAAIIFMGIGLYYSFLYPPSIMKRNTQAALQVFADAVDTQDRAKVSEALAQLLTDDAKIHLDVTFSAISSANLRPLSQDFDKAQFIAFIDNILYTLTDFHTRPKLQEFSLGENAIASVHFTSNQWADGPSYFSGVSVIMRFSGDAECSGEAVFDNKQPKLKVANCSIMLRSVAKSDSAGGPLKSATELREMLNQQQR